MLQNAPVHPDNDDYFEDLAELIWKNIRRSRSEKEIKPGSYKDRLASAPDNKNMKILNQHKEDIAK